MEISKQTTTDLLIAALVVINRSDEQSKEIFFELEKRLLKQKIARFAAQS